MPEENGNATTEVLVAERSDKVDELFAAISAAQGMVQDVSLDGKNPFFKSRYATLGAVLKSARPALAKHGLSIIVLPEGEEVSIYVTHQSGQFIKSTIAIGKVSTSKKPLQELGSTLTYLRRYAICGTLQIVGDEDLDGNDQEDKPKTDAERKAIREKAKTAVKKEGNAKAFTQNLVEAQVVKLRSIMVEKNMTANDVVVVAVKLFGGQVRDDGINKKQYGELIEALEKKEVSK